jgi:hypothetical protein
MGGESGFWRDFTSDPAVAGTAYASSAVRSSATDLGNADCDGLQTGRTPDELILDIPGGVPRDIQKALLDAAIDNLCPDYGTGT